MSRYLCHLRADLKYKYRKKTVFQHRKTKTRQECYCFVAYQKISTCVIHNQRRIAWVQMLTPSAQEIKLERESMERAKTKGKVKVMVTANTGKANTGKVNMGKVNMEKKDVNKKEKSETKA